VALGSRLTEGAKLIEKSYRKKMRKQIWKKTVPSFRNFKIDVDEVIYFQQMKLVITNLLDIDEPPNYSKINTLNNTGATILITSIICPVCKKPIFLNEYWNSFICEQCEEHEKKIYEITRVVVDNGIPQIITTGKEMV